MQCFTEVLGSAVYRFGTTGGSDAGGAFESVHETVIGFIRVKAEGTTTFRCGVGSFVNFL